MPTPGPIDRPSWVDADRLLVVLSDIEMGAGGPHDDFPHSEWLADLLQSYAGPRYDDVRVDLVFNGDTFDLLKTPYQGAFPHLITPVIGTAKMNAVADAHPAFFQGIARFLEGGPDRRRVHFVVGNHDVDLVFASVRGAICDRIGPTSADGVHFAGVRLEIGDVLVEHGNQVDPMFSIDPDTPFLEHEGTRIIDLPWGTIGLLEVAMPLKPVLYHHDRLRPRQRVFDLLPEVEELLRGVAWRYWTRDYWGRWFRTRDPVKKVSWAFFKEIAYRLGSKDFDLTVAAHYHKRLKTDGPHRVVVIGHEHRAAWWSWGNRRLLQTGCFRDEFMIEEEGALQAPIPKTLAEVWMKDDRAVCSRLVEIEGPPPPAGWMPESIFDVLPAVRERLESASDRKAVAHAARKEDEREAAGKRRKKRSKKKRSV